ncbi:MAG TPA: hypothetical protein VGT44_06400, partial [Ktedonobacteraceae bacterium]|nr:hypothetical protein [Ktedonobacteraceae bacterium]
MARTNAERARAYRENKKRREAEAAALLAQGLQPPPEAADEGAIQVTVNAPSAQQQATTLTLKERLFGGPHKVQVPSPGGGKPAPARKTEGAGGGKKLALVSSAMPTILAGVLVANVRDRLPEDYQPCAPTRQEASAMLTPLFEELARYVEVTGRASETVVNLINVLVAMLAYGARSYVTYVEIKHANRKKILVEGSLAAASASAAAPLSAAGRGDEAAAAGASGVD